MDFVKNYLHFRRWCQKKSSKRVFSAPSLYEKIAILRDGFLMGQPPPANDLRLDSGWMRRPSSGTKRQEKSKAAPPTFVKKILSFRDEDVIFES